MKKTFLFIFLASLSAYATQVDDTPIGYYDCPKEQIFFSKKPPVSTGSKSLETCKCSDLQLLPSTAKGPSTILIWKKEQRDGILWLQGKLKDSSIVWIRTTDKKSFYSVDSTFSTTQIWEHIPSWDQRIYKKAGGTIFEAFAPHIVSIEYLEKKIVNDRLWIKVKAYDGHLCGDIVDLPRVIKTGWILAVNEVGEPNITVDECD